MADSSLTRTGERPPEIAGGDTRTLGPSDSSDSGSDVVGAGSDEWLDNDSDAAGTGERPGVNRRDTAEAPDVNVDQVIDEDDDVPETRE